MPIGSELFNFTRWHQIICLVECLFDRKALAILIKYYSFLKLSSLMKSTESFEITCTFKYLANFDVVYGRTLTGINYNNALCPYVYTWVKLSVNCCYCCCCCCCCCRRRWCHCYVLLFNSSNKESRAPFYKTFRH